MYDPEIHHRRSIRLEGYDYSRLGAYFVTVCVKNKENSLGKIIDDVGAEDFQPLHDEYIRFEEIIFGKK